MFWVCPRERFLYYFVLFQGQGWLGPFLGRAQRSGQARGPSAAARADRQFHNFQQNQFRVGKVTRHFLGRALPLGQAIEPSAAAWTGQRAERCRLDRLESRALRLGQTRKPSAAARTDQRAERCGQDRLGGRAPRL